MQGLRRIVKALENDSRSVEIRFDLTGPQLWALWELGRTGTLSLKNLAAKGLVTRNPDAKDRRRISVNLTAKGTDLLQAAPHPAQGHLLAGLEDLECARVESLSEALSTLMTVLEADHLEAPFFFPEE
jgi:DNA-binding HxlR family transcriptional regulator